MDDFLGKPLAVGDVVARISRGGGRRGFRKGVVVGFTKKKVGVGDEVGGYAYHSEYPEDLIKLEGDHVL